MLYSSVYEFAQNISRNKRIMCLDMGKKFIGIACSDTTQTIASPFLVYQRRTARKDLGELNNIFISNNVDSLIVGLPTDICPSFRDNNTDIFLEKLSIEDQIWTMEIMSFAGKIAKKSNISVCFYNESFSTIKATKVLRETKMSKKKSHIADNKIAACIVLQEVLDQLERAQF